MKLEINKVALSAALQPRGASGDIIVSDDKGEIRIIIGDATFRRSMEGLELIEDFIDEARILW